MDTVNCQHKTLVNGEWAAMSFYLQMGNIGSEVSRSLKWYGKMRRDSRCRLSGR